MYDFQEIYYPKEGELDLERVRETRSIQSLRVRASYPTADTAPNSPFGDTHISPAAFQAAGMEEAVNRILSDLDPENIAKGVAYNCDFVRAFLKNFGIYDESSQASYGILRMIFTDRSAREIDRSIQYRIGDGIYRAYLPFPGPLNLLAPGETGSAGVNSRNYSPYSTDGWAVDLLIMGEAGNLAPAGTQAEIDTLIPGLVAASALSNFRGGTSPGQLQELARQVRSNFYPRTPVSRGGAMNMVRQRFPEITSVASVVSGDVEMVRDAVNPGQVAAGRIDLLVRSADLIEDAVELRLNRGLTEDGATYAYSGWLELPETPIRIVAVAFQGIPLAHEIYSVTGDAKKPGLSAAYGTAERLFIRVPEAYVSSTPVINPSIDPDDSSLQFARFTIQYEFDPDLKTVQEFIAGDENTPAGVDLYVRWFVPMEISDLRVEFNRSSGVSLNLTSARADILAAYNSHTIDNPATPAVIADAMLYAGAHSVSKVTMTGEIRFSVAGKVYLGALLETLPSSPSTWQAFVDDCEDVPEPAVTSAYEPQTSFIDTDDGTFAASGNRNVSWLLDSSNLELVEVKSV